MEWPPPNVPRRNYGGIDTRCWTQAGIHPAAAAICALENCNFQLAMARCMEFVYDQEDDRLEAFFKAWIGNDTVCTYIPVAGNFPAVEIVIQDSLIICVVSGTDNFQQLALQCFDTLQGPTDVGPFSTVPFWNNGAVWLNAQLLALGAPAGVPIFFAGHSYGAALSVILAARMKQFSPERDVCVLTFGCPKFGDLRLRTLLDEVNAVHVVNEEDIVPLVPPNIFDLEPFETILGDVLTFLWGEWQAPHLVSAVQQDGRIVQRPPAGLSTNDYAPLILQALLFQPMPAVEAHRPAAYRSRLELNCPFDDCGPFPPAAWDILFEGVLAIGAAPPVPSRVLIGQYGPPFPTGRVLVGQRFASADLVLIGRGPARADLLIQKGTPAGRRVVDLERSAVSTAGVSLPDEGIGVPIVKVGSFGDVPEPLTPSTDCMSPTAVSADTWYVFSFAAGAHYYFDLGGFVSSGTVCEMDFVADTGGCGFAMYDSVLVACTIVGQTSATWPAADSIVRTFNGSGTNFSALVVNFPGTATVARIRFHV